MAQLTSPGSPLQGFAQFLMQLNAQKQAQELQKEDLKLRKQRMQLDQEAAQAEAAQRQAAQQSSMQGLMGVLMGGDPQMQQAVGQAPGVSAFLGQLGDARATDTLVSLGATLAAPQHLMAPATTQSAGGVATQAIAGITRERTLQEADSRIKAVLDPKTYATFKAIDSTINTVGLPQEITRDIYRAVLPENAADRVQRIKTSLEIKGMESLEMADTSATALLKAQGLYPKDLPELVPGSADLLQRLVEAERKSRININEAAAKASITDVNEGRDFVADLASKLMSGQTFVGPNGEIVRTQGLTPEAAVAQASELALRAKVIGEEQFNTYDVTAIAEQALVTSAAEVLQDGGDNSVNARLLRGDTPEQVRKDIRDFLIGQGYKTFQVAEIMKRLTFTAPNRRRR